MQRTRSRINKFISSLILLLVLSTAGGLSTSAANLAAQTGTCQVQFTGWNDGYSTMNGIGGTAWDDIWAVGDDILHWDGFAWSLVPTYSPSVLNAVSAISRNDAWAVGWDGEVLHWDGQEWRPVSFPIYQGEDDLELTAVDAIAPDDVWVAGDVGTAEARVIAHWDGITWTQSQDATAVPPTTSSEPFSGPIFSISAVSHNDVWAAGWGQGTSIIHWDGKSWTVARPLGSDGGEMIGSISALGPYDVWAMKRNSTLILHWDGNTWQEIRTPIDSKAYSLTSMAVIAHDNIWAIAATPEARFGYVEDVLLLHWDGKSWNVTSSLQPDLPHVSSYRRGLAAGAAIDGEAWFAGGWAEYAANEQPWLIGELQRACRKPNQPVGRDPLPPPQPVPGLGQRYFPETGKTITGIFLDYWRDHGGLAQFGYPISEPLGEVSTLNWQTYTVQYFERAVMEYHPENTGTQYEVLLMQLGTLRLRELFPYRSRKAITNGDPGGAYFPQTQMYLRGQFLGYWQDHGGLAQFGYPITNEFHETSDLDGKTYLVQYFERAVMEYHPENDQPYDILLTQLGRYRYNTRYSP